MSLTRRRFLTLCAATACAAPAWAASARWQGRVFGAEASITLHGPGGLGEDTLAWITDRLRQIERMFSLHDPGSELCRLNREKSLAAPPAFHDLLALSRRVHAATDGGFDPTVQPLWRALADGGDIESARAAIGLHRVRTDGRRIRIGADQALTFNGIAQGFAADDIRTLLVRQGFTQCLVDMGEFAAIGGPFRLGISDPSAGVLARRSLTGGAMATSSPAVLTIGGLGHILGPSGQIPQWSTVSVQADSAALADAASTALCLLPLPAIRRSMRVLGLHRVTLIDAGGELTTL